MASDESMGGFNGRGTTGLDKGGRTQSVPEGFTLGLALFDAVPVVLFALAAITLGRRLQSPAFVAGAVLAFCGGAGKVAWKLVIALAHRNLPWLSKQMRVLMPAGFAAMVAGAIMSAGALVDVLRGMVRLPSLAFALLWIACMVAMGHFARHRKQDDARSNWMEQGVNTAGQAALLVALLLAG